MFPLLTHPLTQNHVLGLIVYFFWPIGEFAVGCLLQGWSACILILDGIFFFFHNVLWSNRNKQKRNKIDLLESGEEYNEQTCVL